MIKTLIRYSRCAKPPVRLGPSRELRMCNIAMVVIGWIVCSLPVGVLIGKFIRLPEDEEVSPVVSLGNQAIP